MPLLDKILKRSAKITKIVRISKLSPFELQKRELKKLLTKAKITQFGTHFRFEEIISTFKKTKKNKDWYKKFSEEIPIYTYNKIFNDWWHFTLEGKENITWRGKINHFALSSGTSESASKRIPITKDMLKAIRKTGSRQLLALKNFNIPPDLFTKGVLMLGGSTDLMRQKDYYEGDLSGIMTSKLPFWFQYFYKPGKKIAKTKDWNAKLDLITANAKNWDMGYVAGVPAWMTILFERIIKYYNVSNIHEVWPNLSVFAHGGVSFEPYKNGFEKLLGKPLIYIDTYLASEGFIAYQEKPNQPMKLVLNNGIFFEFVPFNEQNFDEEGDILPNATSILLDEVKVNVDYALLISTVAGAWRYVIGDTVRFLDTENCEIVISGRTKHYISLCGEHLSVDNMNKAIKKVSEELNITIKEYAISGVNYQSMFAHQWYIGTDDAVDEQLLKTKLDEELKILNDDYKTERLAAIREVFVKTLPNEVFYGWMRKNGKEGGQNKFPRVLKKDKLEDWKAYLAEQNISI
jgi:hypothetical protein